MSDALPPEIRHQIEVLLAQDPKRPNRDLARRVMAVAYEIASGDLERLDLKILSASLREFHEALSRFVPHRSMRKATVFGSARTPRDHPDYQLAFDLGRRLAEANWMIVTGGGPGIMQAAMEGAGPDRAFGVGIELPFEHPSDDDEYGFQRVIMKYFFTRKVMLVKESHAFVSLPGGLGTLDETFEVLTLMQTGKAQLAPLVLLQRPQSDHYGALLKYLRNVLIPTQYISASDLSLVSLTDSMDEAVSEILNFYTTYHSMRWVRDSLILRLNTEPSSRMIDDLNREFSDILSGGPIVRAAASKVELSDNDHVDLPRLAMPFNKRSYGRLRELLDCINGHSRHGGLAPIP